MQENIRSIQELFSFIKMHEISFLLKKQLSYFCIVYFSKYLHCDIRHLTEIRILLSKLHIRFSIHLQIAKSEYKALSGNNPRQLSHIHKNQIFNV